MNLADIRIALAVAREGSLSAASERLGITQPTLSKAIARLERENKIRLFERLARGMRPTELGQAFLMHAQRLDLEAADLYSTLRDLRQAKAGVLRLGIGQGIPDRVVRTLALSLTAQGVSLELGGGMTDSLQSAVAVGDMEFALIGLTRPPGTGLKWVPLCDDPMQPMAPNVLALPRGMLRWSALAALPWIVPAVGTASRGEFVENFRSHGLEAPLPIVASRSSGREVMLGHVLRAVVLMTRSLAEEPVVQAAYRPVKLDGGWASRRKLVIVHREGGYLSPAASRAMEVIRSEVAAG